jgi:hypothetical protein
VSSMYHTKVCGTCQEEKSVSEFGFKDKQKGKLQYRCKQCQSECSKKHYLSNKDDYRKRARKNNVLYRERNRQFISEYKSEKGCHFCQESTPICLDFHHLDPNEKEINISVMSRGANSIETIMKEIDKCLVICSNCHRKLHAGLIEVSLPLSSALVKELL